MPEVKLQSANRVNLIESERGWGQKIDAIKYFDNEAEARQWAADYNRKHNNLDYVPDWYIRAEYVGKVG